MIRNRIIALIWFSAVSLTGYSQLISPERAARNNMEKGRWNKVEPLLRKALRKDSVNAPARYIFALYFFDSGNPAFNPDSAYSHVLRSQADLHRSSDKERDRAKRFPLDSIMLLKLREKIDSAAFALAAGTNTEEAYLKFLYVHTTALQRSRAAELRDEVAYLDALKENTYEAFLAFLTRYPDAVRAKEAREKYERLLFEEKTRDNRLTSFENFLKEFPHSPYRRKAELQIFEQMTASGAWPDFETFLGRYPQNQFVGKARNILYHIALENGNELPAIAWTDSLQDVYAAERKYLTPFYKDGKYGFLDQDGKEVIPPITDDIKASQKCGNITDDIFVFNTKIVAKNGVVIFTGSCTDVEDLGFGYLLIARENCSTIIHKSGAPIVDCADDARILNGRMIALKKKDSWRLHTLSGRDTHTGEWEDISVIGEVFIFQRNGKQSLARGVGLKLSGRQNIKPAGEYDEVKAWPDGKIWVRQGELQGVLDQSLAWVIRPDRHILTAGSSVWLARSVSGYHTVNRQGNESVLFSNVVYNENWVSVRKERWRLYDPWTAAYISPSFDSVAFTGPFALGIAQDSMRIYFTPNRFTDVPANVLIEFIPGKDSTSFLVVGEGEKKTIFNRNGVALFTAVYDKVQYAGSGVFIVQRKDKNKKDKRGLVTSQGQVLLPPEFDAIGSVVHGSVSLLKDKKFGLFDIRSGRQIKPEFSKNVTKYASDYLTAFKGTMYGFITWDGKPHGEFEFEEIRYWNDTTCWVKQGFQWKLYNIRTQKVVEDNIRDYSLVVDTDKEKIAIVHQDGHYGVISNTQDEIIPPTLDRIVNVGSSEHPMYFTAKHVEEADIYVVIYYDKNGVLLRRQVYEDADYKMIFCGTGK